MMMMTKMTTMGTMVSKEISRQGQTTKVVNRSTKACLQDAVVMGVAWQSQIKQQSHKEQLQMLTRVLTAFVHARAGMCNGTRCEIEAVPRPGAPGEILKRRSWHRAGGGKKRKP